MFEYWPVVLNGNSITMQRPMVAKTKTKLLQLSNKTYENNFIYIELNNFYLNIFVFISKWQHIRLISPFSNFTSTFWLNMTFPKKALAQICFSKKGLLSLLKLINKEPSSKHSSKHLSYYSIEYSFRWTVSVFLFT